jgi:hypothetical protein
MMDMKFYLMNKALFKIVLINKIDKIHRYKIYNYNLIILISKINNFIN